MSLFKPTKAKEKLNPRTAESNFGGSYLMNDLNWGNQEYPERQIAGMTGNEQDVQNQIYKQAMDGGKGYQMAMDHYGDTMAGNYDPRTSDYYQGYRNEMEDMRNDSNATLKRRSQMGGMANSTPAYGMEADNNRRIDNAIMRELGGMYENERGRMDNAAMNANNVDNQRFSRNLQADVALAKERVIEQMRYDELYERAYEELMHQYNVLAPIAGQMMNYSPGTWSREGGLSDWDTAMGVTSDVMGVYTGMAAVNGGSKTSTQGAQPVGGGSNPSGGSVYKPGSFDTSGYFGNSSGY